MLPLLSKYLKTYFTKKNNIFFTLFLSLIVLAQPAAAFNSPESTYQYQFDQAVYHTDEMNLQSFVHEVIKAIQASGITAIIGCFDCPGGKAKIPAGGLLWTLSSAVDAIYQNPPASGVYYLADIGTRLGVVSPTFAQGAGQFGIGFHKMAILLPLWKAFRDVAYVLFALVFVITGLAIMLKFKIDPKTAITIESALPKIIVGLLLVTFSYAIVGFAIDIMIVVNNLVIFVFQGLPYMSGFWNFSRPVTSDIQSFWAIIGAGLPPVIINLTIFAIMIFAGAAASWTGVGLLVGAGGIILLIIYSIIMVIAFFKLLVTLIKAYANIVLALVFSPFQIALGSLPGSSAINGWFKNLFANLAVLPTVTVMASIAGYITIATINTILGGILVPIIEMTRGIRITENLAILQSNLSLADFGTITVMFTISNAILLMAPKAAEMIQGALSGKGVNMGAAAGDAIAPLAAVGGYAAGIGTSALQGGATGFATPLVRGALQRSKFGRDLQTKYGGDNIETGANEEVAGRENLPGRQATGRRARNVSPGQEYTPPTPDTPAT